jgi:CBS domain-containing protein
MRVRDLIQKKSSSAAITVPAGCDIISAANTLIQHRIGGVPVLLGSGGVAGFVSERDIVRAASRTPEGLRYRTVDEIMQRPAPTCSAEDELNDVVARMNRERLRHVVVLDEDRLAGILSIGDFVKHRLEELETEAGVLRDYVVAQRART